MWGMTTFRFRLFGMVLLTAFLFINSLLFLFSNSVWADDVSSYVSVTTANERSVLDRRTRMITSTADVTITNVSDAAISAPFHAVIDITDTAYENVLMPSALGGPDSPPYNKYYYDLSSSLTEGNLSPAESVTFTVTFVRFYTIRFRYEIQTYGVLEAPPENHPPVLNAIEDHSIQDQS